jgi:chromosome segregation ATPase
LRTTLSLKALPTAASAAAPGTLRATTTMRAALPLKATTARAQRAEERARVAALRAQIDELNAALVVANAEAKRALAKERQRADRLNEQVKALTAEVVRAEKQAEAAVGRAERAEAGRDAERARAEALRTTIEELNAGQALMREMHARELAVARHDARAAQQAAAELRQAEAERKARGLLARLREAWRRR